MRLLISLFLSALGCAAFAQPDPCLPACPVNADYPANTTALETLFRNAGSKAELSPEAYEDLKAQINRCNNDMEVALSGISAQMSELSFKYQQILGYKDVEGIEKQLREQEENLKKSRAELEQNLGYVKHSGVFVVLLENVNFFEGEQKDRIARAGKAVTLRAVEDLIGVNIRRSSRESAFEAVSDLVQEIKNGEVRLEREYFNASNTIKKQFLFVGRFGATPARQTPLGVGEAPAGALVLNLALDTDFRARLAAKGVNEADIRRIEQEVMPFLPNVQRDNKTADGRQDYILQKGSEAIGRIERDIDDARQRLKVRSAKISEICRDLGVPFSNSNFGQSVDAALQKIKEQMRSLSNQWNQTAEREILYKDSRSISMEGSITQSLAAEALKLCAQMGEGYGKLDRVLQVTEVENFDLTKFESSRTATVFRAPRKIWAYAIPRDNGAYYGVALMAQFKVTGVVSEGGNSVTNKKLSFEPDMVTVEGGKYQQGCTSEQGSDCESNETNVHWVQLDAFKLGKTEITNEQFVAFLNDISNKISLSDNGDEVRYNGNLIFSNFCGGKKGGCSGFAEQISYSGGAWPGGAFSVVEGFENHPAVLVSWYGADEYCKWLSAKTGRKYRLPTEAEWEYAARGGRLSKNNKYAGSQNLGDAGWFDGNSGSMAHPVAQKKTNELGLFDMSGNVWEWCADWYDNYGTAAQTNPVGPINGSSRVFRGGSWNYPALTCRVSNRYGDSPEIRGNNIGFRVASSP